MAGLFQLNETYKTHFSVGALLTNDNDEICCHYFDELKSIANTSVDDFYILMRETPHEGESIEDAVERGLLEEFGAEGEIKHYLGSIQALIERGGIQMEKTTIYFHVVCRNIDSNRRASDDVESHSQIVWMEPNDLIQKMKEQRKRIGWADLDESKIVEDYLRYIKD